MKKSEFFDSLRENLKDYDEKDINESLQYYDEMISDRVEEGENEEEVIESFGDIENISKELEVNLPLKAIIKTKNKGKPKKSPLVIVFLILGFPLWFPLFLTFIILVLSWYIILWSLNLSIAAISLSMLYTLVYGIASTFMNIGTHNAIALGSFGMVLVSIGVFVLFGYLSYLFSKWLIRLANKMLNSLKIRIIEGGNN
jgi:uncharacterized membrane protein